MLADLRRNGVDTVHVGLFDLEGFFRERRFSLPQFERFVSEDPTFVNVLHRWDAGDSVTRPGPYVGEPIEIDCSRSRPHPFEENAAIVIADYAGSSKDLSPRHLLKRAVDDAARQGYRVRAALEFEFIVLDETATSLRTKGFGALEPFAPDNRCWSGLSAAVYSDFVSALDETLLRGDIPVFSLGMELGPGCFEATLDVRDAVEAADDASFFRMFTKAFCRRNSLTASFMAQLAGDFPGLSGHVHLSLETIETGESALYDPGAPDNMSAVFRHFVAGICRLAGEMLPFSAHTVNAYRRLTPGNWAPRTASWAVQNYAAAIRVVPVTPSQCRLEYRLSGADTNPYLVLAFLIAAGLRGVEEKLDLPEPIEGGGPDDTPDAEPLPHDLYEAVERLAASGRAREMFGDTFIDYFVDSRRNEELALRREVSAQELRRYLEAP